MKSSHFVTGLVILILVQIGTLYAFQCWKPERSDRRDSVAVAAEANAARVFSRALVTELRNDPDYMTRDRLLARAKLRASENIRRSQASPQQVMRILAELDSLVDVQTVTAHTERWSDRTTLQRQQSQYDHDWPCTQYEQPMEQPPQMTEEKRLRQALSRQVVPRQLDGITQYLDAYDVMSRQRDHQRDQTF